MVVTADCIRGPRLAGTFRRSSCSGVQTGGATTRYLRTFGTNALVLNTLRVFTLGVNTSRPGFFPSEAGFGALLADRRAGPTGRRHGGHDPLLRPRAALAPARAVGPAQAVRPRAPQPARADP